MAYKKTMQIELYANNSFFNDTYYADLTLPAQDYEIRDALQRVRGVGNNYVLAVEYELPEIYDGVSLPKSDTEEAYAFRLQIAEAPVNSADETIGSAEWISLPIDRATEADRFAALHNERDITDCVYYGFESSIPQIKSEMFGDMEDFDGLNSLAAKLSLLSQTDQVKFKAILSAEHPKDIAAVSEIADNLWKYEMTASPVNSDQFFKQYLGHHLDSRFDREWLDMLLTGNEGNRLLEKLGAKVTDYGVISARGRSLYELVPYNEQEAAKELTTQSLTDEKLDVVEILDRVALFTNGRIADDEIPAGLYKYDLRQSDDGDSFCTIEPHVAVNHGGTILLREMLDFGEDGYIELNEDSSPNFNGELMTTEEFADSGIDENMEQNGNDEQCKTM